MIGVAGARHDLSVALSNAMAGFGHRVSWDEDNSVQAGAHDALALNVRRDTTRDRACYAVQGSAQSCVRQPACEGSHAAMGHSSTSKLGTGSIGIRRAGRAVLFICPHHATDPCYSCT